MSKQEVEAHQLPLIHHLSTAQVARLRIEVWSLEYPDIFGLVTANANPMTTQANLEEELGKGRYVIYPLDAKGEPVGDEVEVPILAGVEQWLLNSPELMAKVRAAQAAEAAAGAPSRAYGNHAPGTQGGHGSQSPHVVAMDPGTVAVAAALSPQEQQTRIDEAQREQMEERKMMNGLDIAQKMMDMARAGGAAGGGSTPQLEAMNSMLAMANQQSMNLMGQVTALSTELNNARTAAVMAMTTAENHYKARLLAAEKERDDAKAEVLKMKASIADAGIALEKEKHKSSQPGFFAQLGAVVVANADSWAKKGFEVAVEAAKNPQIVQAVGHAAGQVAQGVGQAVQGAGQAVAAVGGAAPRRVAVVAK